MTVNLYDSSEVKQRKIGVDDSTKHTIILDAYDNFIMDLEKHANRHAYGEADSLPDNSLRFRQIDKVFGSESSITVSAGGVSTIPKGIFLISLAPNTKVEYSPDGGNTWRTLIPAGQGGVVISDGSNVRLKNDGTSDETSYLLEVL